jgi:hypothetical protein
MTHRPEENEMFPPAGDQVEADRAAKDARLLQEEAADEFVHETAGGDPDADYDAEEAGVRSSRLGTVLAVIGGLIVLLLAAVLFYNFFVSRL